MNVAVGVVGGKVVARWHEPTNEITFDPANAYAVGEALARAAHEAWTGNKPSVEADRSFIADQIKARITDQMRDLMIMKAAGILRTMMEQGKSPGDMALHVVDSTLADVT